MSEFDTRYENKVADQGLLFDYITQSAQDVVNQGMLGADKMPVVSQMKGLNIVFTPEQFDEFKKKLEKFFEENYPDLAYEINTEIDGNKVIVNGFKVWDTKVRTPRNAYELIKYIIEKGREPVWYDNMSGLWVKMTQGDLDDFVKRLEELLKKRPHHVTLKVANRDGYKVLWGFSAFPSDEPKLEVEYEEPLRGGW